MGVVKIKVIDLFAGCGGLSLGFLQSGFKINKAIEFDKEIAYTYRKNHPKTDVIVDDIRNIDNSGLFQSKEAEIIIGGPPCQGFSMAGARIREGFIEDPRNFLFKHYFNVVKKVRPQVFVFENVKGILNMQNGTIFQEILRIFADKTLLGGDSYTVNYKIVKAAELGIPQKRERVIIIGVLNKKIEFEKKWKKTEEDIKKVIPSFFNKVTVRDAIANLPAVTNDGIIINPSPESDYQKYLSCNKEYITNHIQTNHSKLALSRMSRVRSGENFTCLHEHIHSVHSGSYGRLCWDEQAPTITTRFDTPSGGRFIHPEENRTLSPREAARIQSFPDEYVFYGSKTSICKEIGNAVPPKISFFLGKLVYNLLKEST